MERQNEFARFKRRHLGGISAADARRCALDVLLRDEVARRFESVTGLTVASVVIDEGGNSRGSEPSSAVPKHPLCSCCQVADPWGAHLAELRRRPGSHWHKCAHDRWCAVVPVVIDRRSVAACRLVCPGSMGREVFEQHVELLDALVDGFSAKYADQLRETGLTTAGTAPSRSSHNASESLTRATAVHAEVGRALDYVDKRLADPKMSVAGVARDLGVNASYLGHIFARDLGVRMSRYIAMRRIELAKTLLATTDWQIKRIAYMSGHRNTGWFSQVFHELTGAAPSEYRLQVRHCVTLGEQPSGDGRAAAGGSGEHHATAT